MKLLNDSNMKFPAAAAGFSGTSIPRSYRDVKRAVQGLTCA
jgi:hypothetical protein